MDKLNIIKKTLQYSASIGAAGVIGTVAKQNMPAPQSQVRRYLNYAGIYGISGLVGGKVFDYVGSEFDELVEIFKAVDKKPKEK